jgi:addiction module RelB/DinJ family antitoxin
MTTLNISLDDNIRIAADNLFENYGINTVDAVKMFIYHTVKTKHFPFPLDLDFEPRQSLAEAISDTLNDTNLYGPFKTTEDAINDMIKD